MPRICEVCGRVEELETDNHPYDILDVCPECTDHLVYPTSESENE